MMLHAEVETGACGDNLTWSYDSETEALTITGSGAMTDYGSSSSVPWYRRCANILSVSFPDGLTSIGDNAFESCKGLTSVTIPSSVTSIGYNAFLFCTGLTFITIPESVKSIGMGAFWGCSNLKSITISNGVTSIGGGAFGDTPWYNSQPDGVVYINKVLYAYKGTMPDNTSIVIKDGTVSISRDAFYNCTGLTSVTIPESVTSIGLLAFGGYTSLTSITCEAITPPDCIYDVFSKVPVDIPVDIPLWNDWRISKCRRLE